MLTVAVSVAAGVAAITSAFPVLLRLPRRRSGVLFIAGIAIVNLRGMRESGTIFAVPTYLFVGELRGHARLRLRGWLRGWDGVPARRTRRTRRGLEGI